MTFRFPGVHSVSVDDFEKKVLNDANKRMENEIKEKLQHNEQLLKRIEIETKKYNTYLAKAMNSNDKSIVLHIRNKLDHLKKQKKAVERMMEREKRENKMKSVDLTKENTVDNSSLDKVKNGILTPFEALIKGKEDASRKSSKRVKIIEKTVDPTFSVNSFTVKGKKRIVNKQYLRKSRSRRKEEKEVTEKKPVFKKKRTFRNTEEKWVDDGDSSIYKKRMKKVLATKDKPHPRFTGKFNFEKIFDRTKDVVFSSEMQAGVYRLPHKIFIKLFKYQQTCVKWLWQLHDVSSGGILGDEMGLGKTVEVISFLAGLHYSSLYSSSIIVVPATVLNQWVEEFHTWWPYFRVVIYHSTGTYSGYNNDLIEKISKISNGVLITTYEAIRQNTKLFLDRSWGYVVLDEGHKIKNPNADITICMKKIDTPHRILLTGTPIQNHLKELWSLFDFIRPGLLGTLPTFQAQFGVPISIGQYSNASDFNVLTAYNCAVQLRDMIGKYILRRMKKDVGHQLPSKSEHILFCRLTDHQVTIYKKFLKSQSVFNCLVKRKKGSVFQVVSVLRQLCNHPDLINQTGGAADNEIKMDDENFGAIEKSGKLIVLMDILAHWKKNKNRVLVYSQSLLMLSVIEKCIKEKEYSYLRMDGGTAINKRYVLIDKFNEDDEIFIFLLTTKVGGIGVNLTGADRIVLFDPDWNPSTDVQALERCWRIGQTKDVSVYRLMTSGTIEEKMYHRQIFKQFLTNKILSDPKQRRFFKSNKMKELFELGSEYDNNKEKKEKKKRKSVGRTKKKLPKYGETETSEIFSDSLVELSNTSNFRLENFRGVSEDEEEKMSIEQTGEDHEQQSETSLLKRLFSKGGVNDIIDHDKILGRVIPEKKVMNNEAKKIAQLASQQLKKSREECSRNNYRIPTWTGQRGVSGMSHRKKKKFGTKQKGFTVGKPGSVHNNTSSEEILNNKENIDKKKVSSNLNLMKRMINFFIEKGGDLKTQEIVNGFDNITGEKVYIFRALLKEIANFEKGFWNLKPEYL